jgi:hypothetical protein
LVDKLTFQKIETLHEEVKHEQASFMSKEWRERLDWVAGGTTVAIWAAAGAMVGGAIATDEVATFGWEYTMRYALFHSAGDLAVTGGGIIGAFGGTGVGGLVASVLNPGAGASQGSAVVQQMDNLTMGVAPLAMMPRPPEYLPAEKSVALWPVNEELMRIDMADPNISEEGGYLENRSSVYLKKAVDRYGRIGGKEINGTFMYVVDTAGEIRIGTRAGQRMPHPTLIGGKEPLATAAGIVELRAGRIYRINNESGHFRPGPQSLDVARDAFEQFRGRGVFAPGFGELPNSGYQKYQPR